MSRWSPSFRLGRHPDDFATALQQIGGAAEHLGDAAFDRRRQRIADDEVQSRDRARQAEAERLAAEDKARIQARQDAQKQQDIQNAQQGIFKGTDPGLYTGERQYYQAPNLLGLDGALQIEGRKRREDVAGLGHETYYDPTRDQGLMAKNREAEARQQENAARFANELEVQRLRGEQEERQIRLRGQQDRATRTTPLPPRAGGSTPRGGAPDMETYILRRMPALTRKDSYGIGMSPEDARAQAEAEWRAGKGAGRTAQEQIMPEQSGSVGGPTRPPQLDSAGAIDPVMWERFQAEKRRGGR